MSEDNGWVIARGSIAWIAALLLAFGAVAWIERESKRPQGVDATDAPAIRAAWSYYERNADPRDGAYLDALVAAREAGVIDAKDYDARMERGLAELVQRPTGTGAERAHLALSLQRVAAHDARHARAARALIARLNAAPPAPDGGLSR